MLFARDSYKEYADRCRQPSPVYAPGDYIWLSSCYIKITRPYRKLDHKRLNRFKVFCRVGSHVYLLELPATKKIYPVFHISLLKPCNSDPLPGQVQAENPPPNVVDDNNEWEVEEILDSRVHYQTPLLWSLISISDTLINLSLNLSLVNFLCFLFVFVGIYIGRGGYY